MEALLAAIKQRFSGWEAWATTSLYVDDGIVTTYGRPDAIALLHQWVTRLVLDWIAKVLRKETAADNMLCVAFDPRVRDALRPALLALGIPTMLEGEIPGTDYAAGGSIRHKKAQKKRRQKAVARKGRLKWWRCIGGRARRVAKTGAQPTLAYGACITGLSNSARRGARRVMAAATPIQCGGASTAAKLAIGGEHDDDFDPHITLCTPPPPWKAS